MLERAETLLIVIKSIGLGWPTAKALLQLRAGNNAMPRKELEQALSNFERINRETAQQALAIQRRQDSAAAGDFVRRGSWRVEGVAGLLSNQWTELADISMPISVPQSGGRYARKASNSSTKDFKSGNHRI